jgi:hypothetical protein
MHCLQAYSVMIDPDEHARPLILSNAERIDIYVMSPWGAGLTQNAIEKKQ